MSKSLINIIKLFLVMLLLQSCSDMACIEPGDYGNLSNEVVDPLYANPFDDSDSPQNSCEYDGSIKLKEGFECHQESCSGETVYSYWYDTGVEIDNTDLPVTIYSSGVTEFCGNYALDTTDNVDCNEYAYSLFGWEGGWFPHADFDADDVVDYMDDNPEDSLFDAIADQDGGESAIPFACASYFPLDFDPNSSFRKYNSPILLTIPRVFLKCDGDTEPSYDLDGRFNGCVANLQDAQFFGEFADGTDPINQGADIETYNLPSVVGSVFIERTRYTDEFGQTQYQSYVDYKRELYVESGASQLQVNEDYSDEENEKSYVLRTAEMGVIFDALDLNNPCLTNPYNHLSETPDCSLWSNGANDINVRLFQDAGVQICIADADDGGIECNGNNSGYILPQDMNIGGVTFYYGGVDGANLNDLITSYGQQTGEGYGLFDDELFERNHVWLMDFSTQVQAVVYARTDLNIDFMYGCEEGEYMTNETDRDSCPNAIFGLSDCLECNGETSGCLRDNDCTYKIYNPILFKYDTYKGKDAWSKISNPDVLQANKSNVGGIPVQFIKAGANCFGETETLYYKIGKNGYEEPIGQQMENGSVSFIPPTTGRLYLRIADNEINGDYCAANSLVPNENDLANFTNNAAIQQELEKIYSNLRVKTYSFRTESEKIFSGIFDIIMEPFTEFTSTELLQNIYLTMTEQNSFLQRMLNLFVILYIALMGTFFISGMSNITIGDITARLIKIGLVYTVLSPSGWQYFYQMVFFFINGAEELAMILSGAINGNIGDKEIKTTYELIDILVTAVFQEVIQLKIAAMFFSPAEVGWLLVVMFYLSIYFILYAALKSIIVYITIKLMLAILFIIAPLFIILIIFDFSKNIFGRWLNMVISYAFQIIILFMVINFFIYFIFGIFYGLFSYGACWEPAWVFSVEGYEFKILDFWRTVGSDPRYSLSFNVSRGPDFNSLCFFLIMCYTFSVFIDKATELGDQLAGGGASGLTGGNLAKSAWNDFTELLNNARKDFAQPLVAGAFRGAAAFTSTAASYMRPSSPTDSRSGSSFMEKLATNYDRTSFKEFRRSIGWNNHKEARAAMRRRIDMNQAERKALRDASHKGLVGEEAAEEALRLTKIRYKKLGFDTDYGPGARRLNSKAFTSKLEKETDYTSFTKRKLINKMKLTNTRSKIKETAARAIYGNRATKATKLNTNFAFFRTSAKALSAARRDHKNMTLKELQLRRENDVLSNKAIKQAKDKFAAYAKSKENELKKLRDQRDFYQLADASSPSKSLTDKLRLTNAKIALIENNMKSLKNRADFLENKRKKNKEEISKERLKRDKSIAQNIYSSHKKNAFLDSAKNKKPEDIDILRKFGNDLVYEDKINDLYKKNKAAGVGIVSNKASYLGNVLASPFRKDRGKFEQADKIVINGKSIDKIVADKKSQLEKLKRATSGKSSDLEAISRLEKEIKNIENSKYYKDYLQAEKDFKDNKISLEEYRKRLEYDGKKLSDIYAKELKDDLDAQIFDIRDAKTNLKKEQEQLDNEKLLSEEEMKKRQEEIDKLDASQKEIAEKLKEEEEKLKLLEEELEAERKRIEELKNKLSKGETTREYYNQEKSKLEGREKASEEKRQIVADLKKSNKDMLDDSKDKKNDLKQFKKDKNKELSDFEKEIEKHSKQLEEKQKNADALAKSIRDDGFKLEGSHASDVTQKVRDLLDMKPTGSDNSIVEDDAARVIQNALKKKKKTSHGGGGDDDPDGDFSSSGKSFKATRFKDGDDIDTSDITRPDAMKAGRGERSNFHDRRPDLLRRKRDCEAEDKALNQDKLLNDNALKNNKAQQKSADDLYANDTAQNNAQKNRIENARKNGVELLDSNKQKQAKLSQQIEIANAASKNSVRSSEKNAEQILSKQTGLSDLNVKKGDNIARNKELEEQKNNDIKGKKDISAGKLSEIEAGKKTNSELQSDLDSNKASLAKSNDGLNDSRQKEQALHSEREEKYQLTSAEIVAKSNGVDELNARSAEKQKQTDIKIANQAELSKQHKQNELAQKSLEQKRSNREAEHKKKSDALNLDINSSKERAKSHQDSIKKNNADIRDLQDRRDAKQRNYDDASEVSRVMAEREKKALQEDLNNVRSAVFKLKTSLDAQKEESILKRVNVALNQSSKQKQEFRDKSEQIQKTSAELIKHAERLEKLVAEGNYKELEEAYLTYNNARLALKEQFESLREGQEKSSIFGSGFGKLDFSDIDLDSHGSAMEVLIENVKETEKLKAELEAYDKDLLELEKVREENQKLFEEEEKHRVSLEKDLQKLDDENLAAFNKEQEEFTKIQIEKDEIEANQIKVAEEIERLNKEQEEIKESIAQAEKEIAELEKFREEEDKRIAQEIEKEQEAQKALEVQIELQNKFIKEQEDALALAEEELQQKIVEQEKIDAEIKQLEIELEEQKQKALLEEKLLDDEIIKATEELERLKKDQEAIDSDLEEKQKIILEKQSELDELRLQEAKLDEGIKQNNLELEKLQQEQATREEDYKAEQERLQNQLNDIMQKEKDIADKIVKNNSELEHVEQELVVAEREFEQEKERLKTQSSSANQLSEANGVRVQKQSSQDLFNGETVSNASKQGHLVKANERNQESLETNKNRQAEIPNKINENESEIAKNKVRLEENSQESVDKKNKLNDLNEDRAKLSRDREENENNAKALQAKKDSAEDDRNSIKQRQEEDEKSRAELAEVEKKLNENNENVDQSKQNIDNLNQQRDENYQLNSHEVLEKQSRIDEIDAKTQQNSQKIREEEENRNRINQEFAQNSERENNSKLQVEEQNNQVEAEQKAYSDRNQNNRQDRDSLQNNQRQRQEEYYRQAQQFDQDRQNSLERSEALAAEKARNNAEIDSRSSNLDERQARLDQDNSILSVNQGDINNDLASLKSRANLVKSSLAKQSKQTIYGSVSSVLGSDSKPKLNAEEKAALKAAEKSSDAVVKQVAEIEKLAKSGTKEELEAAYIKLDQDRAKLSQDLNALKELGEKSAANNGALDVAELSALNTALPDAPAVQIAIENSKEQQLIDQEIAEISRIRSENEKIEQDLKNEEERRNNAQIEQDRLAAENLAKTNEENARIAELDKEYESNNVIIEEKLKQAQELQNQIREYEERLEQMRIEHDRELEVVNKQIADLVKQNAELRQEKERYRDEMRALEIVREQEDKKIEEKIRQEEKELRNLELDIEEQKKFKENLENDLLRNEEDLKIRLKNQVEIDEEIKKLESDIELQKQQLEVDEKLTDEKIADLTKELESLNAEKEKIEVDLVTKEKEVSEMQKELGDLALQEEKLKEDIVKNNAEIDKLRQEQEEREENYKLEQQRLDDEIARIDKLEKENSEQILQNQSNLKDLDSDLQVKMLESSANDQFIDDLDQRLALNNANITDIDDEVSALEIAKQENNNKTGNILNEIEEAQSKQAELNEEIAKQNEALEKSNAEAVQAKQDLDNKAEKLTELENEISDLAKQEQQLQKELNQAETEEEKVRLQEEIANVVAKKQASDVENQQVSTEHQDLSEQLSEANNQALEAQDNIANLQKQNEDLDHDITTKQVELSTAQQDGENIDARVKTLAEEKKTIEADNHNYQDERERLASRNEELNQEISELGQGKEEVVNISRLEREESEVQQKIIEQKASSQQISDNIAQLNEKSNDLDNQLDAKIQQQNELNETLAKQNEEVSAQESKVNNLQNSKSESEQKLAALEAEEAQLNNVLAGDTQEQRSFSNEEKKVNANDVIEVQVARDQNAKQLLNNGIEKDNLEKNATKLSEDINSVSGNIAENQSQIAASNDSITAKHEHVNETQDKIYEERKRAEEVESDIASLEKSRAEQLEEHNKNQDKLAAAVAEEEQLRSAYEAKGLSYQEGDTAKEAELDKMSQELASLSSSRENLENKVNQSGSDLQKYDDNISKLAAEGEGLQASIKSHEDEIIADKKAIRAENENIAALESQSAELHQRENELKAAQAENQANLEKLSQEEQALNSQKQEIETRQTEVLEKAEQIKVEEKQQEEQIEASQERLKNLEQEKADIIAQNAKLSEELEVENSNLQSAVAKQTEAQDRYADNEQEINKIQEQQNQVTDESLDLSQKQDIIETDIRSNEEKAQQLDQEIRSKQYSYERSQEAKHDLDSAKSYSEDLGKAIVQDQETLKQLGNNAEVLNTELQNIEEARAQNTEQLNIKQSEIDNVVNNDAPVEAKKYSDQLGRTLEDRSSVEKTEAELKVAEEQHQILEQKLADAEAAGDALKAEKLKEEIMVSDSEISAGKDVLEQQKESLAKNQAQLESTKEKLDKVSPKKTNEHGEETSLSAEIEKLATEKNELLKNQDSLADQQQDKAEDLAIIANKQEKIAEHEKSMVNEQQQVNENIQVLEQKERGKEAAKAAAAAASVKSSSDDLEPESKSDGLNSDLDGTSLEADIISSGDDVDLAGLRDEMGFGDNGKQHDRYKDHDESLEEGDLSGVFGEGDSGAAGSTNDLDISEKENNDLGEIKPDMSEPDGSSDIIPDSDNIDDVSEVSDPVNNTGNASDGISLDPEKLVEKDSSSSASDDDLDALFGGADTSLDSNDLGKDGDKLAAEREKAAREEEAKRQQEEEELRLAEMKRERESEEKENAQMLKAEQEEREHREQEEKRLAKDERRKLRKEEAERKAEADKLKQEQEEQRKNEEEREKQRKTEAEQVEREKSAKEEEEKRAAQLLKQKQEREQAEREEQEKRARAEKDEELRREAEREKDEERRRESQRESDTSKDGSGSSDTSSDSTSKGSQDDDSGMVGVGDISQVGVNSEIGVGDVGNIGAGNVFAGSGSETTAKDAEVNNEIYQQNNQYAGDNSTSQPTHSQTQAPIDNSMKPATGPDVGTSSGPMPSGPNMGSEPPASELGKQKSEPEMMETPAVAKVSEGVKESLKKSDPTKDELEKVTPSKPEKVTPDKSGPEQDDRSRNLELRKSLDENRAELKDLFVKVLSIENNVGG